jgi:hypothetical protein
MYIALLKHAAIQKAVLEKKLANFIQFNMVGKIITFYTL